MTHEELAKQLPSEIDDLLLASDSIYPEQPVFTHAPMDLPVPFGTPTKVEDPSGNALAAFYSALRRAETGAGQARIVFYGASHVASDYITGYIRHQLQARFGDAGAGFMLPAKPWPWYRNQVIDFDASRGWKAVFVRVRTLKEDRYGLAGVALDAARRRPAVAAFRTHSNGQSSGQASRFELFFLKQPNGGKIHIVLDQSKARVISTLSKGFETGYELIETTDAPHRYEIRTEGDGAVRLFGVAVERERPGVILDTLGVPGYRASYHLLWDDPIYREHLTRRRPDLVVLAYGTNEVGDKDAPIERYESELRQVVARVRDVTPAASCLLVGPSDRPEHLPGGEYEPRARIPQVVVVQRQVAKDFGCGFFDLVACTGGAMSMVAWAAAIPPYGASDHVHFTRLGYYRIGELLLQALLARYSNE